MTSNIETNNNIPVFFENDSYYLIENILDKNWNRIIKKKGLSILYELCNLWWKRIDEAVIQISQMRYNNSIGNSQLTYKINDEIGYVQYYLLKTKNKINGIVIESFYFNLPWRTNEYIQILSANDALKETWGVRTKKIPMKEESINKNYSYLNKLINKCVTDILKDNSI
jgi:hypothetical protein